MYCLETYLKTAHRKQIFRTVYLTSYAMQGARPTSTSTWTSVPSSSAINFVYTQIKYRRKYTIADIAQLATQIGTTKRKYANWLGKFLSLHFFYIYIYIILMFTQWILYVTMFTHVTYDYGNGRFGMCIFGVPNTKSSETSVSAISLFVQTQTPLSTYANFYVMGGRCVFFCLVGMLLLSQDINKMRWKREQICNVNII